MPEPIFRLAPEKELVFARPFTQVVKENLEVRNCLPDRPVAFKIKTTAPKQYCVRPNAGRIRPGESVVVQVMMQPLRDDPPADHKCKDKFLVQCMEIDAALLPLAQEAAALQLKDLWADKEKADKAAAPGAAHAIHEAKLRVSYAGVRGAAAPAAPRPGLSHASSESSVGSMATVEPAAAAAVSAAAHAAGPAGDAGGASGTVNVEAQPHAVTSSLTPNNPVTKPTITSQAAWAAVDAGVPTAGSLTAVAADAPAPADGASAQIAALEQRLRAAQAEIARLSADGGLRQRRPAADAPVQSIAYDSKGTPRPYRDDADKVVITGIPPKIVLVALLVAFLFGVVFF